MRRRSVVTTLVVLAAGLTAAAVRRRASRLRRAEEAAAAASWASVPLAGSIPMPAQPEPGPAAVVVPFARRVADVPAAAPARCGDSGGRTKAGAPCGARAASGGRCHHHRLAA
jgi:hypothetical protein